METTSIEERMRELTNQVILPPKAGQGVGQQALTHTGTCRWTAGPPYSHALRLHRQAGPLRSVRHATRLGVTVPCVRTTRRLCPCVNVSHVWLCIKEVSGRTQRTSRTSLDALLQARRQRRVTTPRTGEGTS
jgi:hypothetical protein